MKLRSRLTLLVALALSFLVAGCGGTSSTNDPAAVGFAASGPPGQIRFDPSVSDVPLPMDLLRSQTTGFNNLPGTTEPFVSMNTLQGFSTAGPILINFNTLLDPASVNAGSILLINTATGQPQPVTFELGVFTAGNTTVKLYPVLPLDPATQHLVIVTNKVSAGSQPIVSSRVAGVLKLGGSLVDQNGNSTVPSLTNAQAQALEPLRAAWQAVWAAAETITGQPRANIPFAWTFTTQPLFQTMPALHAAAETTTPVPTTHAFFANAAIPGRAGTVDQFFAAIGQPTVPHANIQAVYIGSLPTTNYISDPVNGPFQGTPSNPTPVGTISIPFVAFKGASAANGTVLFGHGITRSKLDSIAVADAACQQGLGMIAIDFVLHGTVGFDQTFSLPSRMLTPTVPDTSGDEFINLANLRMSRDNIRQSANDLFHVTHMIELGNTNFDGQAGSEFSTANQVYLGQSLGGIIGTVFASTEPNVQLANLNVPGGRVSKLLLDSPEISPQIIAGLAAAGVNQGTYTFEQFFWIAQTVVDDADPMNYGPHILGGDLKGGVATDVLVQEMIDDQVIPNSATTDLIRSMGIPIVLRTNQAQNVIPTGVPTVSGPFVGSGMFQYVGGTHGFLLGADGPALAGAAQLQVYTHTLTGIASGYTNSTIIVPPGQRTDVPDWRFPFDVNLENLIRF